MKAEGDKVQRERVLLVVWLVIAAVGPSSVSACSLVQPSQESSQDGTVEVQSDTQLESQIYSLDASRTSAHLHDLTDWDWDRVSVFFEGQKSSVIIAEVGPLGNLTNRDRVFAVRGDLIVFQLNGSVVKIIGTSQNSISLDMTGRHSYTGDVQLVPYPTGGGLQIRDADSPPQLR